MLLSIQGVLLNVVNYVLAGNTTRTHNIIHILAHHENRYTTNKLNKNLQVILHPKCLFAISSCPYINNSLVFSPKSDMQYMCILLIKRWALDKSIVFILYLFHNNLLLFYFGGNFFSTVKKIFSLFCISCNVLFQF